MAKRRQRGKGLRGTLDLPVIRAFEDTGGRVWSWLSAFGVGGIGPHAWGGRGG